MSLSPIAFFGLLDETNPVGSDSRTISDDQHRNILASCKQQAPNWTAAVTATHGDVNLLDGYVAAGIKPMPGQGGVTVLFAYNSSTPPAGWTVEEPDTNLRELVIGPAASGGTIGGTQDPTNLTQSAPVTTTGTTSTNGAPHTHTFSDTSDSSGALGGYSLSGGGTAAPPDHTHNVSGTTSAATSTDHSHTTSASGTADVSLTPRYARGILMKLDA